MTTTVKAVMSFAAATLAVGALASCGGGRGGKLHSEDFERVCSGGSVPAARPYAPGAKAHKALYFEPYKGDDLLDLSTSLPADWTVPFSPSVDAFKAIDLVVCARRAATRQVKICDKFENHGSPTQNKVHWHTATYEFSLFEAKTGKKLATQTVEATDSECPMLENFKSDSETIDDYAQPPAAAVADFLRPHMTH